MESWEEVNAEDSVLERILNGDLRGPSDRYPSPVTPEIQTLGRELLDKLQTVSSEGLAKVAKELGPGAVSLLYRLAQLAADA